MRKNKLIQFSLVIAGLILFFFTYYSGDKNKVDKIDKNILDKEAVKFGNKSYNTLHYNFSSTDKKLSKGKKLNTDVWYDEKNLNWVKASFDKKGKWEYKLVSIK